MEKLNALGWVAEQDYDLGGFRFAVRSNSTEFLGDIGNRLAPYRARAPEAVWPVFSVVAPVPGTRSVGRSLHVGYLNHVQIFRYDAASSAQAALFAGIDAFGRRGGAGQVPVDAAALVLGGRGLLVYGPWADRWASELVGLGARRLSEPSALVELSSARLVAWPLRTIEGNGGGCDRSGRPLSPLAELTEPPAGGPVRAVVVARAGPGPAAPAQVVAELTQRCVTAAAPGAVVFRLIVRVVHSATMVNLGHPTAKGLRALIATVEDAATGERADPRSAGEAPVGASS